MTYTISEAIHAGCVEITLDFGGKFRYTLISTVQDSHGYDTDGIWEEEYQAPNESEWTYIEDVSDGYVENAMNHRDTVYVEFY